MTRGVIVACALGSVACGDAGGREMAVSVVDSSGIRIVTSRPATPPHELPWRIPAEPVIKV